VLGGVALACVAGRAEAADARFRVSIPPRPYADALIDLGVQANVSILGTSSCGGGGRAELAGRYTLDEALSRLLVGAPCRYRIVDSRTVRIVPYLALQSPPPPREPLRSTSMVAEVVVTATKRPATLDSLPAGVSAISREQIAATGAVEVGQTVGQLAGVLTTNLGPGRDKLLIRGLSDGAFTGRARSTVSTYLDDAPLNYNAPDPDLRLVDVDRVEVVRGPQGALYGSGAVAGIYRIVTRKPDLERAAFGGSATIATTQGGDRSHELDGYASLPLLNNHAAIRLVAYQDVQGGYLDDANLQISNVDQTRRSGGRLALRIQVADNWRFDALAATQHLRSDDTQYVTAVTRSTPPAMPMEDSDAPVGATVERRNQVREVHNNDFSYAGGMLQGDFGWGSVTSSLSYVHHVFSSQYDATAALDNFQAAGDNLGVFTEASRADLLVQDLVIRSSGAGRFDWLIGAYAARTTERTPSTFKILSAGPVVVTAYDEARKDRLAELAAYGEGTYDFSDGWSATLGGRVFQSRVHTTADIDVIAPFSARSFDRSRTFNGFSPKISLQKELRTGDLVYALITEGYRPGGFNSSGILPIRESRTTFAADRLRNYELGAKLKRFDGRLAVRAAAYYDDWTNIQTDQYRPSGLPYTANVGDARILGLEAEIAYDWSFGLSIQLNGLISDSKVRNPNPEFPNPGAAVVDSLPGVPKTSGGLLAVYQHPIGGDLTLRLVGEASYVGHAGLSFDASLPPRMGHYLRARLSAEVANENWRLTAFVSNPFNDAGDTFAYGNPFSLRGASQVTPLRPRTAGLRLAATF
jgi:outer membrane receptor protein involved in Fe transport